jgi:MATE family multidrug resistance protein
MIGQLGQTLVSVADSIMVGKFLGTIPLAAISLAVSILIIPMVFAIGVAYGLTPLVAGADGKEDPAEAVNYFKNGLVLNSILGIACVRCTCPFCSIRAPIGSRRTRS